MAYATLAELRTWVGIPSGDIADDATLTLALDSASALVDAYTDTYFAQDAAPVARRYDASSGTVVDVPGGIATTAGLTVATDPNDDGVYETVWAPADYRLEPTNAAAAGRPWTRIVAVGTHRFPTGTWRSWPGVLVTATGGWPAVPAPVRQATLIQAAFIWGRKDSRFGVAGSPEFGNELRVESALDRTAQALLRPYRRRWFVVT